MKKRIEKVVESTQTSHRCVTKGKRYKVFAETESFYTIMNNEGNLYLGFTENFKVVSEREVLEFEGEQIANFSDIFDVRVFSEIDLANYDLKVIATHSKAKDIEYWKNNAEENYMTTPLSVLKYIGKLEKLLKAKE